VARDRVRNLVAEHRGEARVVARDRQDPRVHRHLATGQAERIDLLVVDDAELPPIVPALGGFGDARADAPHLIVERGVVRDARLLQNVLIRRQSHLQLRAFGNQQQLRAIR
jgi:hypothetical protein